MLDKLKTTSNICIVLFILLVILGNTIGRTKTVEDYKYFKNNSPEGTGYYIKAEKLISFSELANYEKGTGKKHAVLEKYYAYVDDKGASGIICLGDITNDHFEDSVLALDAYSKNPEDKPEAEPLFIYGNAQDLSDDIKNSYHNEIDGVSRNELGNVYLNGRITPEKEPFTVVKILAFVFLGLFIALRIKISNIKKQTQV